MISDLLARIWRRTPRGLRRLSMRVLHTRFTVTAGAVVINEEQRVLLLKHRFRGGSGWGIPGGFVEANEHPHEAIKRELTEEVGLTVDEVEIMGARTFGHIRQIEILFRCRGRGEAKSRSSEIKRAAWFTVADLPAGLPRDQETIIRNALADGGNARD